MKHLTFITAVMLSACMLTSCGNSDSGKVYICTGPQSHAYHTDPHCKGLQHCSRSIEKISIEKAE